MVETVSGGSGLSEASNNEKRSRANVNGPKKAGDYRGNSVERANLPIAKLRKSSR